MSLTKHELESLPSKPAFPPVNLDAIPPLMREHVQWVLWGYEWHRDRACWTKVPYYFRDNESGRGGRLVHSKSTEPSLWMGYAVALNRRERMDRQAGGLGIGFVLTDGDDFVCIDLDDCRNRDTGEITPGALAIITEFDTYTEVSPSGTGVKLFLRGRKTCNRSKNVEREIEVYERARFVTMTGLLLPGLPAEPQQRQAQLDKLTRELFPSEYEPKATPQPRVTDLAPGCGPAPAVPNLSLLSLSDADIIDRASNASNGMKFRPLWTGDASAHNGDRSSADLALACMLAFWTGPDAGRIESLMRQSGLARPKWDRTDYLPRTIARALSGTRGHYGDGSARRRDHDDEFAPVSGEVVSQWFAAGLAAIRAKKAAADAAKEAARREAEAAREATRIEASRRHMQQVAEELVQAIEHIRATRGQMFNDSPYRCSAITQIPLICRETFEPRIVSVRCQKATCCGCRRWLIDREHTSAAAHFAAAGQLYEFGCDAGDWVMMRKRIKRAKGQYLRVRDGAGWYVVTNVGICGAVPVPTDAALSTLALHLEEWGDTRPVSTSRGWKLPELDAREQRYERVGVLAPSTTLRAIREAADGVKARAQWSGRPNLAGRLVGTVRFIREEAWTRDEAFDVLFPLCLRDPQPGWRGLPLCPGVTDSVSAALHLTP